MAWYSRRAPALTRRWRPTVPMEWLAIDVEHDTYITSRTALNLATGPLGDWHRSMWRVPAGTVRSTRTPTSEECCRIGTKLWGRLHLVDARKALTAMGHPAGKSTTAILTADHPRAVAEEVMYGLRRTGQIHSPDPRTVRRWLTPTQRKTCASLLTAAAQSLDAQQHHHLEHWISEVTAAHDLLDADDST